MFLLALGHTEEVLAECIEVATAPNVVVGLGPGPVDRAGDVNERPGLSQVQQCIGSFRIQEESVGNQAQRTADLSQCPADVKESGVDHRFAVTAEQDRRAVSFDERQDSLKCLPGKGAKTIALKVDRTVKAPQIAGSRQFQIDDRRLGDLGER